MGVNNSLFRVTLVIMDFELAPHHPESPKLKVTFSLRGPLRYHSHSLRTVSFLSDSFVSSTLERRLGTELRWPWREEEGLEKVLEKQRLN